jgi:predicted permease
MHTHTHTTAAGDVFLPSTIIKKTRRNMNRKRPPSPLGAWLIMALASALACVTIYLVTK